MLGTSLVIIFVARTLYLLRSVRKTRKLKDPRTTAASRISSFDNATKIPLKTLVVLGSGGHTTEMLDLIKNLNPDRYGPIVLVVADTDTTSLQRVQAYPHPLPIQNKENLVSFESKDNAKSTSNNERQQEVYRIPRSREVGQSYSSSVLTTLRSFVFALWLVGIQVGDDQKKSLHCCRSEHAQNTMRLETACVYPSFRAPARIDCLGLVFKCDQG